VRFLKIIQGRISVENVDNITFKLIQQEVGGNVERHIFHAGVNNRFLVIYLNEDAKLQGHYKNFLWLDQWIAGHAVIVAEKRNGNFLSLSDHEFQSVKFLDRELICLMPSHQGYTSHRRRESE
jgi:hypothetical protein